MRKGIVMYNNPIFAGGFAPDVDEIADAMLEYAGRQEDDERRETLKEAIYHLNALAENEYNADYWRVLYDVLQEIAESVNVPLF